MKDYASMSDFEINSSVSVAAGLEHVMFFDVDSDICSGPVWELPSGKYVDYQVKKGCAFDPCNNPADAWSILVKNKISLNYMVAEEAWCAHVDGVMTEGCWCWDFDPEYYHDDKNPLRAGMIVFLMMKENEND